MRLEMSKSDPAEPADTLKGYPIWEIVIHDSTLSISVRVVKKWVAAQILLQSQGERAWGEEVAERAGFEPARAR